MIDPQRARPSAARWAFALLLCGGVGLFALLLLAPRADGQLVGSDGVYYYMFARSLAIDGDLNFANEYRFFQIPIDPARVTPAGRVPNQYAVGPALLWMPFFLAAHGVALIGHARWGWPPADGYQWIYQGAISVGSIFYGVVGLWLCFISARRIVGARAALAAALLFWAAGNACYYWVIEPSMAHMVALFAVALLLTIWLMRARGPDPPPLGWACALGAAGGLALLVRLQDGLALIIPIGSVGLRWLAALRRGDRAAAQGWLAAGAAAAVAALIVFAPQLIVWWRLYGTLGTIPYMSDRDPAFYWHAPQIAGVLLSSFHGLLSWHPIYGAALAGLPLLARRDSGVALGGLLLLALTTYLVAAWWAWWQGDSFGGRMFLSAGWVWVLGLAALLDRCRAPRQVAAAAIIALALIGWNGLSLAQYRLGLVPRSAPLTWEQMTTERALLPWRLLGR